MNEIEGYLCGLECDILDYLEVSLLVEAFEKVNSAIYYIVSHFIRLLKTICADEVELHDCQFTSASAGNE